nr:unnamed protein product [Callosobruchus analis]
MANTLHFEHLYLAAHSTIIIRADTA